MIITQYIAVEKDITATGKASIAPRHRPFSVANLVADDDYGRFAAIIAPPDVDRRKLIDKNDYECDAYGTVFRQFTPQRSSDADRKEVVSDIAEELERIVDATGRAVVAIYSNETLTKPGYCDILYKHPRIGNEALVSYAAAISDVIWNLRIDVVRDKLPFVLYIADEGIARAVGIDADCYEYTGKAVKDTDGVTYHVYTMPNKVLYPDDATLTRDDGVDLSMYRHFTQISSEAGGISTDGFRVAGIGGSDDVVELARGYASDRLTAMVSAFTNSIPVPHLNAETVYALDNPTDIQETVEAAFDMITNGAMSISGLVDGDRVKTMPLDILESDMYGFRQIRDGRNATARFLSCEGAVTIDGESGEILENAYIICDTVRHLLDIYQDALVLECGSDYEIPIALSNDAPTGTVERYRAYKKFFEVFLHDKRINAICCGVDPEDL